MLCAESISYQNGGRRILADVNLMVSRGTILALLGPSGAGKSTVLRLLAGLEQPDAGRIVQEGQPVNESGRTVAPHRRKIAMIFQSLALWPHLSLEQHLEFVMDRSARPDKKKRLRTARELLEMLRLPSTGRRYPESLSGGEKQRLAIARALAQEPEYLFMDEPFSNLDDLLREELHAITAGILRDEKKMGIVYITHTLGDAITLADRMAVLCNGTVAKNWEGEEIPCLTPHDILPFYRPA